MVVVESLSEARDFFLKNCIDNCICVNGDKRKEVDCYIDVEEFFKDNN